MATTLLDFPTDVPPEVTQIALSALLKRQLDARLTARVAWHLAGYLLNQLLPASAVPFQGQAPVAAVADRKIADLSMDDVQALLQIAQAQTLGH